MITPNDFTLTKNDINGNPRYILHFFNLLNEVEGDNYSLSIMEKKAIALNRAKKAGGKAYKGKDFGGGIVFQSYNLQSTCDALNKLVQSAETQCG